MALNLTTGQLQALAAQHEGSAQELQGQLQTHVGLAQDMAVAMQGSAGSAYTSVTNDTLVPNATSFISALNEHAANLRAAGGSYDSANEENTASIKTSLGNASTSNMSWT